MLIGGIDYIPDYLSDDTKVALRVEMDKVHSTSDVPGYIYTFEIRGPFLSHFALLVSMLMTLQTLRTPKLSTLKWAVQSIS